MKSKLLPLFAVLFAFMFALALAGCGGSSDSAADDAAPDTGAAVEQAVDDTGAAVEQAADTADQYADVNPELKAIGDQIVPLSAEFVSLVEQAKAADDPSPFIAQANELTTQLNDISKAIGEIDQSTLTEADMAYLNDVVMPPLNDMMDAASDMLDLI